MVAPYGEGELEADGEDALRYLVCASAKGMRIGIECGRVCGVGRVVPPHVEALHDGRSGVKEGHSVRLETQRPKPGGRVVVRCEGKRQAVLRGVWPRDPASTVHWVM